jgi:hypothetical protein
MVVSSNARKLVFGAGNVKKKQIVSELAKRGLGLRGHNEADAYVIAECLRLKELKDVE